MDGHRILDNDAVIINNTIKNTTGTPTVPEIVNTLRMVDDLEELKKALETTKVQVKDYPNKGLAILFTPFQMDINDLTPLEKQCRSIVIDRETLGIVSYSQSTVYYNDYCTITNAVLRNDQVMITESFEGTMLNLFCYNGAWRVATRKCLDNEAIAHRCPTTSYLDLAKSAVPSWDIFISAHDPQRTYLYVLVHHKNGFLIDYTHRFGKDYSKLVLVLSRDCKTLEGVHHYDGLPLNDHGIDGNVIIGDTIVGPRRYPDYGILDEFNQEEESTLRATDIKNQGVMVSVAPSCCANENGTTLETFIMLHTSSYKMFVEAASPKFQPCTSQQYVHLYQKNALDLYMGRFRGETHFTAEDGFQYQIKGLIDCIFKVLTSEILFLFKQLWDIKYGTQRDDFRDVYLSLPLTYKRTFYVLRGIYFNKRIHADDSNRFVTIRTVYDMLKEQDPSVIVELVIERQAIFDNKNTQWARLRLLWQQYHRNDYMEKSLRVVHQAEEFVIKHSTKFLVQ